MKKGNFEFTKVGSNSYGAMYEVIHLPTGKKLGQVIKAWRGWDTIPNSAPYGYGGMSITEAAQALKAKKGIE